MRTLIVAVVAVLTACSNPSERYAQRCTADFGLQRGQPGFAECVMHQEAEAAAKNRWAVSELNAISRANREAFTNPAY